MNQIEKARADSEQFYLDKKVELVDVESSISPSNDYELKIQNYEWRGKNAQGRDAGANFARVEVWNIQKQKKVLEFDSQDTFWHIWIQKDSKEFLVFAEHRGGQSVIEFPSLKFESYFKSYDDFIWTEFHPSPDLQKLAIIGCHWACPYEAVIYEFSSPLQLPLTIIFREVLGDDHENFDKWINNNSFSLITERGVRRTVTF